MSITDNNFQKISKLWIFADPIVLIFILFPGMVYLLYLFNKMPFGLSFFVTLISLSIIFLRLLKRLIIWHYFSFSFENEFLVVKENVLRRRERKISYDHIENISTKNDLMDYMSLIFGLRSLKLFCSAQAEEAYILDLNPSNSGFDLKTKRSLKLFILEIFFRTHRERCFLGIGSCKRFIIIPGLTKNRFESLKKKVEMLIGSRTGALAEKNKKSDFE